ncbi:MAG TPA: DUF6584 family protein [Natronosporangium sp.]|nr:DUF6584 family protein [Natronosporangium sp.]
MGKAEVLARVKQDLAVGHTYPATQRLRTLIAIDPHDLELRDMLAEVYRQTGNLAEAGRWGFLTANVAPEELAAFERANPDPWLRLRMLRWTGDEADLPTEAARTRLRALVEAAARSGPPALYRGPLSPAQRPRPWLKDAGLPCLFVVVTLAVAAVLAGIGVVRAIAWLVGDAP